MVVLGREHMGDSVVQFCSSYFKLRGWVFPLTLSRPLDINYVLDQGHGHLSKYLISGFIFHFFHAYMKKISNPSLKKKVS